MKRYSLASTDKVLAMLWDVFRGWLKVHGHERKKGSQRCRKPFLFHMVMRGIEPRFVHSSCAQYAASYKTSKTSRITCFARRRPLAKARMPFSQLKPGSAVSKRIMVRK